MVAAKRANADYGMNLSASGDENDTSVFGSNEDEGKPRFVSCKTHTNQDVVLSKGIASAFK